MSVSEVINCLLKHVELEQENENGNENKNEDKDKSSGQSEEICMEESELSYSSMDEGQLNENIWHKSFKGYKILTPKPLNNFNALKSCIELNEELSEESIENFFRSGINSFIIDFFLRSCHENKYLIIKLRKIQAEFIKESGFQLITTVIARLCPRFQYTGKLLGPDVELEIGNELTISMNRYWAGRGHKKCIYVNAKFMLPKLKSCEIILIGQDIQVQVKSQDGLDLQCLVIKAGILSSHMPVKFPGRCQYYHLSVEELEDILLAKQLDLNVLISYSAGSSAYCKDLRECLKYLECHNICLLTGVDCIQEDVCNKDIDWICDSYDGIDVKVNMKSETSQPGILELCLDMQILIERCFQLKKPILFNIEKLIKYNIIIPQKYHYHVFFCPDKYVLGGGTMNEAFHFFSLQNICITTMLECDLTKALYFQDTWTERDKLAFNIVTTAYQHNVKTIFICDIDGMLPAELAHFRSKIPIILLSSTKCIGDTISLYHNLMMLWCRTDKTGSDYQEVYTKRFIDGIRFAKDRKYIYDTCELLFIVELDRKFQCNYVLYKYDESKFEQQIAQIWTRNSLQPV